MADRDTHDENFGEPAGGDDLHSLTDLIDEIEREAFARSLSRRPTSPSSEALHTEE